MHIAARNGAQANGGEILVSRDTIEAAGDGYPVSASRTVALKGIAKPVEVVAAAWT